MVVGSSILVTVILIEPGSKELLGKLVQAPSIKVSAVTLVESSIVLLSRGGQTKVDALDALLGQLKARVIAVNEEQSSIARAAFKRYGKGRHNQAKLNLGDCFTYALAKQTGEPLLFKGEDFLHTDLLLA